MATVSWTSWPPSSTAPYPLVLQRRIVAAFFDGTLPSSITTTDCRIRWLTVLVQLRISGCGKIATALCQVQFTHKNHLAS